MLGRPVGDEPALLGEFLQPCLLVLFIERAILGQLHALLQVVGVVLRDPRAHFIAELQFLGGEFQIHLILPNLS